MSKFTEFKTAFNKKFKNIQEFMDEYFESKDVIPFGGRLEANLDEEDHDSYGNECSQLGRVYYFEEFEVFVQFTGTRESYSGEEWEAMKEVIPSEKTVKIFELVK